MCASPPPTSNPGLDLHQLAALRRPARNQQLLIERVLDHVEANDGYVAFSGGKDSLVVLHLALQADRNIPVCFFDAQLEFPETYSYIADLADAWDLNLDVITSPRPTLDMLVETGSWAHDQPIGPTGDLHFNKILAPARTAAERYGPGVIWGLRAEESAGRRAMFAAALREDRNPVDGSCLRRDGTTTYSPIWNWSSAEIWAYIAREHLPLNPVYTKLRALGAPEASLRVGAILDGAHLEKGRLVWLRRGWPALFEQLARQLPRIGEFT